MIQLRRPAKPIVAGILNVTPDSFSDGGNFFVLDRAVERATQMIEQGADLIDVGGESTRPGAKSVTAAQERERVSPVIDAIHKRFPTIPISVDTMKSEVARAALEVGATLVNDVSALRNDSEMASVCAAAKCGVILMHSRGDIATMASYNTALYNDDPVGEMLGELSSQVKVALDAGIQKEKIILDPGLGFSKRTEHSLLALKQLNRFVEMGFPVLVGASRKRFIGEITGATQVQDREAGTIAANVFALTRGATLFRVHDVLANRRALDAAHAMLQA